MDDSNRTAPVASRRGRMAEKWDAAAPYHFFLTTVADSEPTHTEPLSVTMQDLFDPSLGELECSLQMNFLIDVDWLLEQYCLAGYEKLPLLILYGAETRELWMISRKNPNVTAIYVDIETDIGLHHTKMGLYGYRDGSMRVVISSANLYEEDWHNRTQGLWISPKLPAVPEGSDTTYGESVTEFRSSLLAYLEAYKLPQLQQWMARVQKSDFSEIRVFLVASVPGLQAHSSDGPMWGHPRLGHLLSKHAAPIDDTCPVMAQSSGVGNYGRSPDSWVLGEFMVSFRRDTAPIGTRKMPSFRMIFPSSSNFRGSYDDMNDKCCLPYESSTHMKQVWLEQYLDQWTSRTRHRNKAMPHIKTYCRWSANGLYWFLLTSANFSKSAWGVARYNKPYNIYSYEAGVLFMPRVLLNEDVFPMESSEDSDGEHPPFPMPYDVPTVPYGPEDTPFLCDLWKLCDE